MFGISTFVFRTHLIGSSLVIVEISSASNQYERLLNSVGEKLTVPTDGLFDKLSVLSKREAHRYKHWYLIGFDKHSIFVVIFDFYTVSIRVNYECFHNLSSPWRLSSGCIPFQADTVDF